MIEFCVFLCRAEFALQLFSDSFVLCELVGLYEMPVCRNGAFESVVDQEASNGIPCNQFGSTVFVFVN